MDGLIEERIKAWTILFHEAEARAYWTQLSARTLDAAMRMLKIGRPIERPVQTELTRLYYGYEYYLAWGLEDFPMEFVHWVYIHGHSTTGIRPSITFFS